MSIYNGGSLSPGLNYTNFYKADEFCLMDGGIWERDRKWCVPGVNQAIGQLQNKALHHSHDYISKNSSGQNHPISFLKVLVIALLAISLTFGQARAQQKPESNQSPEAQPCIKHVERVGDGNPHQSCRWRQVTGKLQCGGGHCGVSHLESRTFTWGLAAGGGMFGTVGFDVSQSYTSGNTYQCSGSAGQTVCVTAKVGYTDYTVREVTTSGNCQSVHHEPYIIYAPNKSNQQNYKCHHNTNCHRLDWEKWPHNGVPC